jgi:hypothetical protein
MACEQNWYSRTLAPDDVLDKHKLFGLFIATARLLLSLVAQSFKFVELDSVNEGLMPASGDRPGSVPLLVVEQLTLAVRVYE